MSVHRRSTSRGVRWDVRLRDSTGRPYKRTFRTRKEGEEFERGELVARDRGDWVDPRARRRTLRDVAGEWLATNPAKRPASTVRDRRALELHVFPALGDRAIGSLTPADIQKLVVGAVERGLAPATVRRLYGPLRATLNHAVNAGYISRSPVRGIKLPAVEPTAVRVLEPSELTAIATALPAEYAPMVWLGAVLGLRWGEVAGLQVRALDLLSRTLRVERAVARGETGAPLLGPPKSTAARRTLAMPDALAELVGAHLKAIGVTAAEPEALLFPSPTGGLLWAATFRSKVWVPACVAGGIGRLEPVEGRKSKRYVGPGFHDLRRTSATALVVDGVDVKTAQYRLGHSSPVLTLALYAQAVTAAERDAADRVGARLMGA